MGKLGNVLGPLGGAGAGAGLGFMVGGPIGAAAGGLLGGGLGGSLFSKGQNPGQAAMPYLNQIPGIGQQYMGPYIQQGQDAYSQLNPYYSQALNNPEEIMNQAMSSYEPSKGYQFKKDQLMKALQATAASGGYAGTEYDQLQRGQLLEGLLSGDMQQWLNNLMQTRTQGIQGLEGAQQRGFLGAGNITDLIGNALSAQGTLAAGGQAAKNQERMGLYNNLMGMGAAGIGAGMNSQAGTLFGNKIPGWGGS